MGCAVCGSAQEIGALCRECAFQVAPHDGLIPDHIRSTVDPRAAEAWLIDGFGGAHAVGADALIGRDHQGDLVVLASSVSREHAELKQTEAGWSVRDLGSRNGTYVNGVRGDGSVALPARARLKVGDVALWFLAQVFESPLSRSPASTHGPGSSLIRYLLVHGDTELCVVAGDDAVAGGALLWRAIGGATWLERSLAPLEFQLLRALCARAHAEVSLPSPVRGCASTMHLVESLPFHSRYANQENVRQVVRRVRALLAEIGVHGLLASVPGRGYYLACRVAVAPAGADVQ